MTVTARRRAKAGCGCGDLAAATVDAPEAPTTVESTEGTRRALWEGPIGIEGMATGDGRYIKPNALRWDTLPVPLRWAEQDFGEHDGAVVVGLIREIERVTPDEANARLEAAGKPPMDLPDGALVIWGSGTYDLDGANGREAFRHLREELTPGISMDLDNTLIQENPDDPEGFVIAEGRVRASTQVAIPAFEGARIAASDPVALKREATPALVAAITPVDYGSSLDVMDSLFDDAVEIGMAVEVGVTDYGAVRYDLNPTFNWVDDVGGLPHYIKRIEKHLRKKGMDESHAIATAINVVKRMCATGDLNFPGAQQVNAGSRAEACKAVAEWEEKKVRAHANAATSLVASATRFPGEWFQNPNLQGPTPLTVTDDGRVFGHIALWNTCHIANPQGAGVCTTPPRSRSNYAYFKTGAVSTTMGDIAVGKITMSTVHAGPRLSSTNTMRHYEDTGTVGAFVNAGEDAFGIWVAGAERPGADTTSLKASPVSGDWRAIAGSLELVGALSVNVPGFPVPRPEAMVASGRILSLVASGVVMPENVTTLSARASAIARKQRARALARRAGVTMTNGRLTAAVRRGLLMAKVKRVAESFGYNEDQWRVPKGNGEKSGRWIDMPGLSVSNFGDSLWEVLPDGQPGDGSKVGDIKADLDKAIDSAALAGTNMNDVMDGKNKAKAADWAKQAAADSDNALSRVEAGLMDLADSGEIDEDTASTLGEKLAEARDAVATVRDADLSLLGDKGFDDEGDADIAAPDATDIGGEGDAVVGDAPKAPNGGGSAGDVSQTEADLLDGGVNPEVARRVAETGDIYDPDAEDERDEYDDVWDVLAALPEGATIRSGTEDDGAYVDWTKDESIEGGWRATEVGPSMEDIFKVGDGIEGDFASLDGGGDIPIRLKGVGDTPDTGASDTPDPGRGGGAYRDISDDPAAAEGFAEYGYTGGPIYENPDTNMVIFQNDAGGWSVADQDSGDIVGSVDSMKEADAMVDKYLEDNDFEFPADAGAADVPAGLKDVSDDPGIKDAFAGADRVFEHEDSGLIVAQREGDGLWEVYDEDGSMGETFDTPEDAVAAIEQMPDPDSDGDPGAPETGAPEDAERENVWKGFEDAYVKRADPNNDPSPDSLREEYDRLIDEQGMTPDKALQKINEDMANAAPQDPTAGEVYKPGGPGSPEPDAGPAGSVQQQKAAALQDGLTALEVPITEAADMGHMSDEDASMVGDELADLYDKIEALNNGIQDGNYNAADLTAVQAQLSKVEAVLMAVADGPDLPEEDAAQIGQALDDLFSQVGDLAASLQGDMTPPPFANRSYRRQWLGRKGIRLDGSRSLI